MGGHMMDKDTHGPVAGGHRRDFLRLGAGRSRLGNGEAGHRGIGCRPGTNCGLDPPSVPRIDPVRIGFVGVGGMGMSHVGNMLKIEGVQVRAICDIVEARVARVQEMVVQGRPARSPKDISGARRISDGFVNRRTSTWC